jgi:hypothetical protein
MKSEKKVERETKKNEMIQLERTTYRKTEKERDKQTNREGRGERQRGRGRDEQKGRPRSM